MMDAPTWAVTILYGLVVGVLLALYRREGRALLGAMLLMTLIGAVVWTVAPETIAGPSMAVGGACACLAATISGMRLRNG